ncbi:MAG: PAS domain-containing protein, partial [Desulfobulbaceae bacterium]|nr:PAS domain-containing protein [Desulfobulbaceae bacterium]
MIDENQKSISREIQIPWLNRILTRVLFLAMAISLLPLLLVGTATVYFVGQDAEQKAENALLVSTADLARQVENYFVLLTEDIKFIAGHFDRENLLSKDNIRFLSAFAATHHDIQIIWAANNAGEYSILYSRAEMLKKTTSTLDIQPLPGQDDIKIVWHDTRYDTFGESIITGSIPIMSPWEDRSSGLLVFEIRPQSLHGLFESIDIGGKGIAMLIDESGQLVSHSNRGVVTTGQDMASHPEIEQLQNEHSDDSKPRMCSFLRVNGKNILSTYQKIEPIEWGVIVERDESEVYRTRNRLIRLVAGCFFALLLLLIPLAILFSWRLTSPLAKLLNTIKEQASGNQAARSNVAIPDEIGVLATTFNQMMSTIHKHTTELKQEITFRKKVEESLRASQVFNETLLNTSPDIIYIYDINERKNVYSNQGIMNILGYSIEEVKAMGERFIANLMHPDDFKVYLNETIPRYQTAKDGELIEHEYRMSHKNGTWCWLQSKESIFLRQDDGTPKQIFGMIGDITERKQAEEELEKHREHLEKLVEKR